MRPEVRGYLARLTGRLRRRRPIPGPAIRAVRDFPATTVDAYWSEHTVNSRPFASAAESERYLQWRCEEYPLFREFMQIYAPHDAEWILDYGCGPGDDLVGFLLYTRPSKVIGIDVSEKALRLASGRLALHGISSDRVELIRTADSVATIPLDDAVVDYVHCAGVLHHASEPAALLCEFRRVLKANGRARIMVYNRDSLWFHLYTAYVKMIVENAFPGLGADEAFSRNTDGEWCPIARCYRAADFVGLAEAAGFQAEFVGGYVARHELECCQQYGTDAMRDHRLGDEHREFLSRLVWDERGYPTYEGKHAGVGGVYRIQKA